MKNYIIIIIIIIVIIYFKPYENFQSIRLDHDLYKPIEFMPIKERNMILTIPVHDYDSCSRLCDTTPDCDGFNYALNNCTLYKHLRNPLMYTTYTPYFK